MLVLAVPDLHAPYHHPRALQFLQRTMRKHKPDAIVMLGDEIDSHAWSTWGKGTATHGAEQELHLARAAMKDVYKLLGKSALVCNSNHIDRAAKRLEDSGVPSAFMRPIREVLNAPANWQWADWHELDGVVYEHGEGQRGAQAAMSAALDNRAPTVIGHLHTYAGIQYHATKRGTLWGMSAGCLIDPASPAFAYARHHRRKAMLGCGVVTDGVPQWLPLT